MSARRYTILAPEMPVRILLKRQLDASHVGIYRSAITRCTNIVAVLRLFSAGCC